MDNEFATNFLSTIKNSKSLTLPAVSEPSNLCEVCKGLRAGLWSPAFSITYSLSDLGARSKSKECDLCGLLRRTCERHGGTSLSYYPALEGRIFD